MKSTIRNNKISLMFSSQTF